MSFSATVTAVRSRAGEQASGRGGLGNGGHGGNGGASWLGDGVVPPPVVTRSGKTEDAVEAGLESHSSLPLQVR
jgi:hypothetical protein